MPTTRSKSAPRAKTAKTATSAGKQIAELAKLKKENEHLKSLLKDAVELLNKYKDILKNPQKLVVAAAKKTRKK